MNSARFETFSDGVLAIAATLLVLDLPVPDDGADLAAALLAQWRSYAAYVVSFSTIGILWVNHHALFAPARLVGGQAPMHTFFDDERVHHLVRCVRGRKGDGGHLPLNLRALEDTAYRMGAPGGWQDVDRFCQFRRRLCRCVCAAEKPAVSYRR